MPKRKTDLQIALYSDTVRPDLRAAVLAIASGDFDRLQSAAFDLTDGGTLEWMEARRLPGGALWTVERHTLIQAGEDDIRNMAVVVPQGCFFDALAYVAQYERNRADIGTLPSARPCALPHYRDVAAQLGLPVDIEGKVHPAADGHLLTEGTFSGRALAVVEKSAPVVPVKAPSIADRWPQSDQVRGAGLPAAQDAAGALAQGWEAYRQVKRDIERMQKNLDVAQALSHQISNCIYYDISSNFNLTTGAKAKKFLWGTFWLATSPCLVPLVAVAYDYMSDGSMLFSGGYQLPRRLKALKESLSALPDGEEKTCLEAFAEAAMPTYYFEKALAIAALCRDGRINAKHYDKGLAEIDRAAACGGIDADRIQALKSDYMAGRVPATGTFLEGLNSMKWKFDSLKGKMSKQLIQKLDAFTVGTVTPV